MIRLTRQGNFNANLLNEQIAAAFPEFFIAKANGTYALYTLSYDGSTLTLNVPDSTDLQKLQSVVAAHNPTDDSLAQATDKERISVRQSIINKFLALGFTTTELKYIRDVLS